LPNLTPFQTLSRGNHSGQAPDVNPRCDVVGAQVRRRSHRCGPQSCGTLSYSSVMLWTSSAEERKAQRLRREKTDAAVAETILGETTRRMEIPDRASEQGVLSIGRYSRFQHYLSMFFSPQHVNSRYTSDCIQHGTHFRLGPGPTKDSRGFTSPKTDSKSRVGYYHPKDV
jgi:hypothetical protein